MKNLSASFYYNDEKYSVKETLPTGIFCNVNYEEPEIGAYTYTWKIKNTSLENSGRITRPKVVDLFIPYTDEIVWRSLRGDSCAGESFMPLEKTLNSGDTHHVEPYGGRSSNTTGFPFFDITYGDKAILFGIGWTGQWAYDVTVKEDGFLVEIGLLDADFYLLPGEEVLQPSVVVVKGKDSPSVRRSWRKLQREKYSPLHRIPDLKSPLAIQPFDRYFQGLGGSKKDPTWPTEEGQIRTAEAAAKCKHFDTLWLDAAWFRKGFPFGVGNFSFEEGFPNGLKGVSDKAHELGMKFLLWFEPERVYEDTEMHREHPEWVLSVTEGDLNTHLLNIGDPDCLSWLKDTLIRMIKENGIDMYRQDFNTEPLPFWRENDEEGRKGITEMKYIENLYALWDGMIEEFPSLFIDNCASGGRRIDFETCKRAVSLWRSDTGCYPEHGDYRTSVWNNNQALMLTQFLAFSSSAIWVTDAYDVRGAATDGLACNFDILNPDFDFHAAEDILEEVIRLGVYRRGSFYPLTEATLEENVWSAYQFACADTGVLYAFRRKENGEAEKTFKLSEVEENATYLLTFSDEHLVKTEKEVLGKELSEGISLTIPAPRESLVMEYKRIK